MLVAVVSCFKYRDAWRPCFALLDKFWPDCPYEKWLITDYMSNQHNPGAFWFQAGERRSWCESISLFTKIKPVKDKPVLLMQEDFFINAPVRQDMIEHALGQMEKRNAGCVRLYPCPGSDLDYGDSYFGEVSEFAQYKVSCQAAIWDPEYLSRVASYAKGSPAEFEITGTARAWTLNQPVLAWKREIEPWPLSYLCSAIGRGLWSQDAKKLCDANHIAVDWTFRGFQPA